MANLVGSPLDSSIILQLAARTQRLSQAGIRAGTDIRYLGQKNAWVRLSSFVSIEREGAKIISQNVNGEVSIPGGSTLSEQWVLKGEVRNTNNLKFGVETGTGAYGTGGIGEIGYRPMPGITGVSVESQPPAGAIRTATIKIKALNLNQLSILDVLYFRLGFSMLLEWGHSIFVDNKNNLINGAIPVDITKATSKEYVLEQLAQKRIAYSYNYDGMLGLVTNYEWTQAGDGSYDCTLRLSGIGSIIESLKINNQEAAVGPKIYPTDVTNAQPTNVADAIVTTPSITTFGGVQLPPAPAPATTPTGTDPTANTTTAPPLTATLDDSSLGVFLSSIQNTPTPFGASQGAFPTSLFASGLDLLNSPTGEFKYGYSRDYMAGRGGVSEINLGNLKTYLSIPISKTEGSQIASAASGQTTEAKYIYLSTLLAYLVNSCTLYNNNNNQSKPVIYIDFNPNTNLCLSLPQQISVDPGVCLIRPTCTDVDYNNLFTIRGIDVSKITDIASPSVSKVSTLLAGVQDYSAGKPFVGKFMNILVNIDCIRQVMAEVTDKDKNIYLGPFLVNLMQKIQLAMGNINDFKVGYDDAANTVFIYDNQIIDVENKYKAIPTIPVFGLTSAVRNYTLKTEASTKIGSMLAITARAGARNSGANTDNTAFTGLNKSLYDRLLAGTSTNPKNTATGEEKEKETPAEGTLTLANSFNATIRELYQGSNGSGAPGVDPFSSAGAITYNSSAVESIKQFYIASMLAIKGNSAINQIDSVAATGILPLALDVTLDGIGGIPLYQAFTLPANRLPAQYVNKGKPRIGFTVAGLSHQIENNEWTTTIRGLMINIPSDQRVYTPDYTKNPNTTPDKNEKPVNSTQPSTVGCSRAEDVKKRGLLPVQKSLTTFAQVFEAVVNNIEGGYYHPDMQKADPKRFAAMLKSGETMYGLDRRAGGPPVSSCAACTNKAKTGFWDIIDAERQKNPSTWKYLYLPKLGTPLQKQLYGLAQQIVEPIYQAGYNKVVKNQELRRIIESDGRLWFHYVDAFGWNGGGWARGFHQVVQNAFDAGERDSYKLTQILTAEKKSGGYNAYTFGTGKNLGEPSARLISKRGRLYESFTVC